MRFHFCLAEGRIFGVAGDGLGLVVGPDGDAGVGRGQPASVSGLRGQVRVRARPRHPAVNLPVKGRGRV